MSILVLTFLLGMVYTAAGNADPVRVDYYMESLCPYCAQFTLQQLKPLFANKLINFVELDIIAWGNAHTDPKTGEVTCQHGPLECELNKLINCAVAQYPIQDDWFPFLTCLEEDVIHARDKITVEEVANKCAVHAGMVTDKLMSCYQGELGKSLQRLAGQRTASLRPAHQYVPWVVVNGVPLLEDADNLMKYICVAYTGRDRPHVCYDIPNPTLKVEQSQDQQAAAWQRQQLQGHRHCLRHQQPT